MNKIETQIELDGVLRDSFVQIADANDIKEMKKWSKSAISSQDQYTDDILEYAELALGKWELNQREHRCPKTFDCVMNLIDEDAECEVPMLLVHKCSLIGKGTSILAFALARRTWKGSIALDYLAQHPMLQEIGSENKISKIKGAGFQLLVALASISLVIKAPQIWGESTSISWKFYKDKIAPKFFEEIFVISKKRCSELLSLKKGDQHGQLN